VPPGGAPLPFASATAVVNLGMPALGDVPSPLGSHSPQKSHLLAMSAPAEASTQLIRVGHSPDADDAFMFYALAKDKIDTGRYRFVHELVDIETLNRRAFQAELELTAVSLHAYAHLSDKYLLCSSGASMGDNYGPMVVTRTPTSIDELRGKRIAVPGTLTTAFLTLQLCLGEEFDYVTVPFDQILDVVRAGEIDGQPIDAGLIIHEGQLTYGDEGLHLVVDLGKWWMEETGYPLPLGANAIRRDLGEAVIRDVSRLLRESIAYGLEHRQDALDYALGFGRGLARDKADAFVGMYVNDWTLDFGDRGRQAVQLLLDRGHAGGFIPQRITAEFV
jgi:1,4-dihydroxy-6-naphthoate synthase